MSAPRPARARGWQFSRAAILARELTARLFGPLVGFWLCGPRVIGREHLEALIGPALIAPTHASHFDVSAVRLALGPRHRRRIVAAAAADYFRVSRARWFIAAWIGAFAFTRTGGGSESFLAAESLLNEGWHVLMFPEGTRARDGEIAVFKPGIGLLAERSGRQVLPVRIVGIASVLPKGSRLPKRSPVEVRFGAPLQIAPGEGPREFVARLEAAVRAL